ncbi:MAG: hypothetical protein FJ253_01470 [Phycisphaerae bacterium]|nr:hypothetical protein [Phycisphaerae bacterium]
MRLGLRMMGVDFQVTSELAAGAGIRWLIDWLRGYGMLPARDGADRYMGMGRLRNLDPSRAEPRSAAA